MQRTFNYLVVLIALQNSTHGISYAFLLPPEAGAHISHQHHSFDTSNHMVFDIFNTLSDTKKLPQLPRDVKEAVSKCREATQAALKDRVSRMDIEFPVGTKFGIEKTAKKKKGQDIGNNKPTREDLDRSDRELARLFIEMFQPVGGDNIVVCFKDAETATAAKKQWGSDAGATAQILSMDRRKNIKKVKKVPKGGFAAKIAAEVESDLDESGPFRLPNNVEVALFVSPGAKELVIIERICESIGMGTLVILLNARLSSIHNFGSKAGENLFLNEFRSVFSLAAASQEAAPGCLLHHVYGKDWVLAQKANMGQPRTILVQAMKPSDDDCRLALEKYGIPEIKEPNAVENAVRTVTDWFR